MHILIASDSFKDALPASRVCAALARGAQSAMPDAELTEFPLADGGEGTYEVLAAHLELQAVAITANNPLGKLIETSYGRSKDGRLAFVEMARTAGLQLLQQEERNPLLTTTAGTGVHIRHALETGVQELVLAIGGSATNDAGMGMATVLGWRFEDAQGRSLEGNGANLIKVNKVFPPENPFPIPVSVICDVSNPLYGPTGAAQVYARQKGADDAAIAQLDAGLRHFSGLVEAALGRPGLSQTPGTGAAGGMGFGAMAFLNARLQPGIELVMELAGFDEALRKADIVLTGEGSIDAQTVHGKLVKGICQKAALHNIPVIGFCGRLAASEADLKAIGLHSAHCINPDPTKPLPEMLAGTTRNLEISAHEWFTKWAIDV